MTGCEEATAAELATADELGGQFGRFMRVMNRAKAHMTGLPAGVEPSAFPILAWLARCGPSRTSTIAGQMLADISTISRQTSAMVQAGLIERQADPDDGRASLLALTDAGREVFERGRAARNRWLASALRDWPKDDVEQLIALFDRLNDVLADSVSIAEAQSAAAEGSTV